MRFNTKLATLTMTIFAAIIGALLCGCAALEDRCPCINPFWMLNVSGGAEDLKG